MLSWATDDPVYLAQVDMLIHPDGVIRFTGQGFFLMQLSACCTITPDTETRRISANKVLDLLVNGTTVASCTDSNASAQFHVSSLCHVIHVSTNDEVTVVSQSGEPDAAGTTINIHHLG